MQCHRCPKSPMNGGTPDESCLNCTGADSNYNGFKTVTPVDDIEKVQHNLEPTYGKDSGLESNGDLIEYGEGKTKRNLEDCEKVLSVLKECHHTSMTHIACMVALFMSMGTSCGMFSSLLNGMSLAEYARVTNTSKQNAHQTWNRLVDNNPIIKNISKRNRRKIKLK